AGYIKRLSVSSYRKQKRGGKGVTAMETREEDFVKHLFVASTKDYLLIFTNKGKAYWLKVYEIPEAGRAAKGKAIVNLLSLAQGEDISSVVAVKEFSENKYLIMCTRNGVIKKTRLSEFSNPRKAGVIAITLDDKDALVDAEISEGKHHVLLASREGKSIRFKEEQIRDMGRGAKGVIGFRMGKKDQVIGMEVFAPEIDKRNDLTLLTVTALGFAKRSGFDGYRLQSRGGKGIINLKVTDKNGMVVSLEVVSDEDEVMAITQKGMIVRCPVKDIRATGRNTQGVRLISLEKGDTVTAIAKVVTKEEE
ncbi:MAG: DNA gyrase C-terminal beta-propeller domain-containing protein, partial [Candidatus Omnitrophica bacterium]|nr:DNA gyrase C-terminal beta-propeller domain-containing protein [Candidatus Omnitrophota bacterium]